MYRYLPKESEERSWSIDDRNRYQKYNTQTFCKSMYIVSIHLVYNCIDSECSEVCIDYDEKHDPFLWFSHTFVKREVCKHQLIDSSNNSSCSYPKSQNERDDS